LSELKRLFLFCALAMSFSACAGASREIAYHAEPVTINFPVTNNPKSAGPMLGYRVEGYAPDFLVLNISTSVPGPVDVAPGQTAKILLQYDFTSSAPIGCFEIAVRARSCSPNSWPRFEIYKLNFIGVPSGGWVKRNTGLLWAKLNCLFHQSPPKAIDVSNNNIRPPDCPPLPKSKAKAL
jgi:hypothetical protein